MAPVVVDPKHVHTFKDEAAFEHLLKANHGTQS